MEETKAKKSKPHSWLELYAAMPLVSWAMFQLVAYLSEPFTNDNALIKFVIAAIASLACYAYLRSRAK